MPQKQNPLARLHNDFNQVFNRFFDNSFMPPMNVREEENRYVVEAELPGLDIDDIDIQVYGNSITIRGEQSVEEKGEKERFHVMERRYGSFHRSFTLPEHINPQNVTAEQRNGVLYIYVLKDEKNRPQKINIKKQDR